MKIKIVVSTSEIDWSDDTPPTNSQAKDIVRALLNCENELIVFCHPADNQMYFDLPRSTQHKAAHGQTNINLA